MSSFGTTAASQSRAIALRFIACVDVVLSAAQAEVATNAQAGVVTIFSTYVCWLKLSGNGVVWDKQALLLKECQELFLCYKDEAWAVPFAEHFVSYHR